MKYGGKVVKSAETKIWSHSYRQNIHSFCEENSKKSLFAAGIWEIQFCELIFSCSMVPNLVMDFEILFVNNACLILQKTDCQILIPKLLWKQLVVCEVVRTLPVELRIYKLDLFHSALVDNHIARAILAMLIVLWRTFLEQTWSFSLCSNGKPHCQGDCGTTPSHEYSSLTSKHTSAWVRFIRLHFDYLWYLDLFILNFI